MPSTSSTSRSLIGLPSTTIARWCVTGSVAILTARSRKRGSTCCSNRSSGSMKWLSPSTMPTISGSSTALLSRRADQAPCKPAPAAGCLFFRCDIDLIVEAHAFDRCLEAIPHARVILVELPRVAAIFELHTVGILEVDGFRPVMVNDFTDLDALGHQLCTFLLESGHAAGFEGEMVERTGHPQAAIDARVVFCRNTWNSACLHEGQQLIATGIKEDVANLAALFDRYRVTSHRLETEHALIELAGLVEVQRGETDVRKSLVRHWLTLLTLRLLR